MGDIIADFNGDAGIHMSNANFSLGSAGARPLGPGSTVPSGQRYLFDLNGDGWNDILITGAFHPSHGSSADAAPQNGRMFWGGANGFQAAGAEFPLADFATIHSRELVTGDFNSDGAADFFIANHGYDAEPFPGERNLLFLSQRAGSALAWRNASDNLPTAPDFTHSAAVGDVNGDGHLDIFSGNKTLGVSHLLLGDGNGAFAHSAASLPAAASDVGLTASQFADLDGDGFPELVLGTYQRTSDRQILWNNTGSYANAGISDLPSPPADFGTDWMIYDIQASDVNFDGKLDLILNYQAEVNHGGWYLQVLVNQGNRVFEDQTDRYISKPAAITSGLPTGENMQAWIQFLIPTDFNDDGRTDFFVDGIAWGGRVPQDNFPVFLVHQADGTFATTTVGDLRALGAPEYIFWGPLYSLNSAARTHTLIAGPFTYNDELQINTQSLEWGAPLTRLSSHGDIDTAVVSGARADYELTAAAGTFSVRAKTDTSAENLLNVERLQFADAHVALDVAGNAGEVAKVLGAVFGAESVATKPQYVGIGLSYADGGMSYTDLAALALRVVGAVTPEQIVDRLFTNLAGVAPSAQQAAPFLAMLSDGMAAGSLAVLAADHALNLANIDFVGLAESGISYVPYS